MQVTVKFTGPMRTLAGRAQECVSLPAGAALRDLLHALATALPLQFVHEVVDPLQTGNMPTALLLVNTVNLPGPAGLDYLLSDGDIVAFVPPMTGG
jgi:molybdopterin converting factor small subunit